MFVRIVHHWCNADRIEEGRAHIDGVGAAMEKAPGFVMRFRMESVQDPTLVATFTTWANLDALAAFQKAQAALTPVDINGLFTRTAEEVFDVEATHGMASVGSNAG